jgi:hypothetical protein
MTDLSHKLLTGNQLHENKGVSSATDNTVATADSGATVWKKLTASNLTGTGNSFGAQLFHITREVSGDGSSIGSGWVKRTLDTTKTNEISSATISSSVISLPAGTYYLEAQVTHRRTVAGSVTATNNKEAQLRVRDTSNSSTLLLGLSQQLNYVNTMPNGSFSFSTNYIITLSGRFTLSGTTNIEVQQYADDTSSTEGSSASSGEKNVYADVKIWKVA